MGKYLFALCFTLLAAASWAQSSLSAVTISKTLTMTSPSALISGTGPSATINMTNGYFRTVSTSNLTVATVNSVTIGPLLRAAINFNGNGSCTVIKGFNTTCLRATTGIYNISFTTPMPDGNYYKVCLGQLTATTVDQTVAQNQTTSPTTTGFTVSNFKTSTGAAVDTGNINCLVYE